MANRKVGVNKQMGISIKYMGIIGMTIWNYTWDYSIGILNAIEYSQMMIYMDKNH